MRQEGKKVGVLKLRMFRPFPAEELAAAIGHAKAIAVLDRSEGFNAVCGPVCAEVKAALYKKSDADISNYIYGLGGRDLNMDMVRSVYGDLASGKAAGGKTELLGVRE
jgi:pyruvate ferredoxin oxidoreductase alpha subunit